MIRERVATNGAVRPLEPERELPAFNVNPAHLGTVPARWAKVYIAAMQRHEKKYSARIRQIARQRERAISLLRSQAVGEAEKGVGAEAGAEGEGWSVAWALEDADERPPPSSLVARCDTTEALALARAAAATKRKRNARLATAASFRGPRKRRTTNDENEKGRKAVHSGGEFWRRLSRGHSVAAPAVSFDPTTTGMRPQVVVVA